MSGSRTPFRWEQRRNQLPLDFLFVINCTFFLIFVIAVFPASSKHTYFPAFPTFISCCFYYFPTTFISCCFRYFPTTIMSCFFCLLSLHHLFHVVFAFSQVNNFSQLFYNALSLFANLKYKRDVSVI